MPLLTKPYTPPGNGARLPPKPRVLVKRLPDDKHVCSDHLLAICPICCVDFEYMDEDDDQTSGFDDGDEVSQGESDENSDQVFVLAGSMARFTPQWDSQILGPANILDIKKDYDNPPKPLPLSDLKVHDCRDCKLYWLQGNAGSAAVMSHPSHHSYSHVYAGTGRSLLVSIDGACSFNGQPNAQAAIGVHFHPNSPFNISQGISLPDQDQQATSQKAELSAAIKALETVRLQVLFRRNLILRNMTMDDCRDLVHFRLVVATDSSYLVETMCSHLEKWTWDEQSNAYVNKRKQSISNSKYVKRVSEEVRKLAEVGVQVVWYHICREQNVEADRLAKAGLRSN